MISYCHRVRARGRDFYYFRPPKFLRREGMGNIRLSDDPEQARAEAAAILRDAVSVRLAGKDSAAKAREFKFAVRVLIGRARFRAKEKGLPATITEDDIIEMIVAQDAKCAVSGIPFTLEKVDSSYRRPFAPSLDRIDNQRGYELDNCRLVCSIANYAMGEWGEAALVRLAQSIVNFRNKKLAVVHKPANKVENISTQAINFAEISQFPTTNIRLNKM